MPAKRQKPQPPPAAARSWTVAHFLPGDFRGFTAKNLVPAAFPSAAFSVNDPRRPAVLTSPELPALFPIDQLLLSAGVVFPGGGSFTAEARVRTLRGWSPWFSFGSFSPGRAASAPARENPFGKMDTDILKLAEKASAFRYRLTVPAPGKKPALIRFAAASYTDTARVFRIASHTPSAPALKLALPRLSQMALKAGHSRDICSPVSLAMVLRGLGFKADPLQTAAAVRDGALNIYGNWFFNTAYAGSRGVYALLARLNSLQECRAFIEAGLPVIASVTFGPGELRNSPLKRTKGHLLVIIGFTARGDVIVNDPAAASGSTVERVYGRAQFERAWLGNKYGLSYIVAKDLRRFIAVKDDFTELYSAPPKDPPERRKLIESQLVFNERAELLEVRGRWARIKASEQNSLRADGRTLSPYEGWTEFSSLAFSLPLVPNAVIRAKTLKAGRALFSMGVKLRASFSGPRAEALPAGNVPARQLTALRGSPATAVPRGKVLNTARAFLGDKYYWGGRSAWGVDCSGLVNLAFRAWGVDLPRNAGDQYYASKKISPRDLKPADLVFSSDAAEPAEITHVMFYSGGGRLLEAAGDSNSVREVTFERKFGAAFKDAANGMVAGGKKIFFRRIIG